MCCLCPWTARVICLLANGNRVLRPESNYSLQSHRRGLSFARWLESTRGEGRELLLFFSFFSFSLLLLLLTWVQMSVLYWQRQFKKVTLRLSGCCQPFQIRRHPHPPLFAEWYGPCCLGELTLCYQQSPLFPGAFSAEWALLSACFSSLRTCWDFRR